MILHLLIPEHPLWKKQILLLKISSQSKLHPDLQPPTTNQEEKNIFTMSVLEHASIALRANSQFTGNPRSRVVN
ncbi:hypothetical protein CL629_03300 [bacterium]|nr:hypothetical protein [bacterium]